LSKETIKEIKQQQQVVACVLRHFFSLTAQKTPEAPETPAFPPNKKVRKERTPRIPRERTPPFKEDADILSGPSIRDKLLQIRDELFGHKTLSYAVHQLFDPTTTHRTGSKFIAFLKKNAPLNKLEEQEVLEAGDQIVSKLYRTNHFSIGVNHFEESQVFALGALLTFFKKDFVYRNADNEKDVFPFHYQK